MSTIARLLLLVLALVAISDRLDGEMLQQAATGTPPGEWIEPETGHRVIRLSDEPGTASLYFHQNGYTAKGDKLLVTTPRGLATIDLKTRKIEQVVEGRAGQVVVGKRTRQVFYTINGVFYVTHLDTHVTREIAKMPADMRPGSGLAVNADETMLAGSFVDGNAAQEGRESPSPSSPTPNVSGAIPANQENSLEARWARHLPMRLFTLNIKTGEIKTFHTATDWLNHVQFSPTDPALLMFCHEGPWHKVDRIWTIRTDGTGLTKIHARTMDMEIAGHEFFSQDGKTIWYDLQTPKSQVFWLAGYVIATGERIRYPIERENWSVHFNISRSGRLFAGDGGGPESVAAPGNGQWIYLFTPRGNELTVERLVNLSKHSYRLEPNVTFTPDDNWIVFRSNMHGATHVYAVEVKKSGGSGR
jgi:oligogalacturonide lyase